MKLKPLITWLFILTFTVPSFAQTITQKTTTMLTTSPAPGNLYLYNNQIYLTCGVSTNKEQEWYKYDLNTSSLTRVTNLYPDYNTSVLMRFFARIGNNIFYSGNQDPNQALEFNRLNLETETNQYIDLYPGTSGSDPGNFIEGDEGVVYFLAATSNGYQIHKWDPSNSQVTKLTNFNSPVGISSSSSSSSYMVKIGNYLYSKAYLSQISEGTVYYIDNEELIRYNISNGQITTYDVNKGTYISGATTYQCSMSAKELVTAGSKLFFSGIVGGIEGQSYGNSNAGRRQLLILDPADATPQPIDISSFAGTAQGDADVSSLYVYNEKVYFKAQNPDHELYVADPATETITKLSNFTYASAGAIPRIAYGNYLYFTAIVNDAADRRVLKLDITNNTISDVATGFSTVPSNFYIANGLIFFQGGTTAEGTELWKYDPSSQTCTRVSDIVSGSGNSAPTNFLFANSKLYFLAAPVASQPRQIFELTDAALPVELVSFKANSEGDKVLLKWATATEINNYGFEIERSTTVSKTWEKVGFVEGCGNSNSPKEYSFTDENPVSGNLQYRLKQIDLDGKYEYYASIVELNFSAAGVKEKQLPAEFGLSQNFPNPFNPGTLIKYAIPQSSHVTIEVYSMLGEKITTLLNKNIGAGYYEVSFDGKNLNSGIYIYRLTANSLEDGRQFTKSAKMILVK